MSDEQFVLLATVPIKAGREDEYLTLVNAVNDEMRHEPTFVNTVLHRSAEDPGLFMLHETWAEPGGLLLRPDEEALPRPL